MSPKKEHAVRTDSQGRYVVQAIPRQWPEGKPTKLRVIVYKDGFVGVDSQPIVVQPGDRVTQVGDPIRLEPGVSLSGRVVDPEGRPVVGASVEVAEGFPQGIRTYKTGPAGRFTVPNLDKGVTQLAFRFGTLVASGYYIAGGKGEDLVQLRRAVAAEPAAAAAKTAPRTTLMVGQPAPEWRVCGWTHGRARSLADFRGKFVILEFWGIWCGGCVTSLPVLDRLREKFEPRGVVFLSIHTPGEAMDNIRKLFALKNVSLVSALDEGHGDDTESGTTCHAYGVDGYPEIFLIDKAGKIASRASDPADVSAMEAVAKKMGIDPDAPLTEAKANRFFEAAYSEAIEKVLAQH